MHLCNNFRGVNKPPALLALGVGPRVAQDTDRQFQEAPRAQVVDSASQGPSLQGSRVQGSKAPGQEGLKVS